MKVSTTHHIRKTGRGKGKLRKNPKRGKYGTKHKERAWHTMFLQDKKTGQMEGRERVLGKGDATGVVREERIGRILGRTHSTKKTPYSEELTKVRYQK